MQCKACEEENDTEEKAYKIFVLHKDLLVIISGFRRLPVGVRVIVWI